VALDAATGKLRWYQQLVHHDIWDYDVPAAPTLIDVKRNGAHDSCGSRHYEDGALFVFNRVTGEPVFGLEERPVPQSAVPGEASGRHNVSDQARTARSEHV